MKRNRRYILYKYNNSNNDIEYIKEYKKIEEIQKDYNLQNKKSVYNYIIKDIDNINSYYNLLNNKYIIIKEDI